MMAILLLMLFPALPQAKDNYRSLCENIFLTDGNVQLNENEQVLICGSEKATPGWNKIPLAHAQVHLKSILQNLGYHNSVFTFEAERMLVTMGERRTITSFSIQGDNDLLTKNKKRKIVGEILTPGRLNEVETWANTGIRNHGYACPDIRVQAQSWDGALNVDVNLHLRQRFGALILNDLDGLNPDVLSRYQPFEPGEVYSAQKTQIMTDRLLSDGLFQSAFFETSCEGDLALLDLKTSVGPPKILRFGIGASTEELPFADLSFRNTRLDNKASSVTSALHASPRLQSLTVDSELYWLPGWYRTFVGPRLRLAREIESSYQTDSGRVGIDIGRNWDWLNSRFRARIGPTLNFETSSRGAGPKDSRYPTVDSILTVMSHDYESLLWQQYEGWTASVFLRNQGSGLGSPNDINRYEINFKHLWNVGQYSPPLFVLGTRLQAITVDALELRDENVSLIPIDDRVFVGGDQNLRGFPRKSINNQGQGYLSFLYLGWELRLIEELPYRLQPFLLWDAGQVGTRRYTVSQPLFISEGLGLRWLSPFGTFRGSVAHGRILRQEAFTQRYPEQVVYFLSFGQEF